MKRGIIGRAGGQFRRIEPFRQAATQDGEELINQVDVTGVKRTPDGLDINEGVAATQSIKEQQSAELALDSIELTTEQRKVTDTTEFLAVPGEFVVVDSKKGRFLFELLSSDLGVDFVAPGLDLQGLVDTYDEATAWKVGYFDPDNPTRNGVLHGEAILESGAYSDRLAGTELNQLGLELSLDGTQFKLFVTSSGYVDIYQPADLDSAGFAEFLQDIVVPHLT